MIYCTIFQGVTHKLENAQIEQILLSIRSTKYKDQVENVRDLITKGKKEDADRKKKLLQSFTPSGTFDSVRKAEKITSYSKYIILDFDHLSQDQLKRAKMKVKNIKHTYATFISPSGNGLKILVPVTSELEQHALSYQQVSAYYSSQLGIPIDGSGKDVCRLCFMSYDPDCYLNTDAIPFELDHYIGQINTENIFVNAIQGQSNQIPNDSIAKVFERCISFTDKKSEYKNGNRNNYIHLLACNCNRQGIPQVVATNLISDKYDLGSKEIYASVKSAYSNNSSDFAKFEKHQKNANQIKDELLDQDDYLKLNPYLPDHIFESLPEILRSGCKVFEDKRRRDVFFTAAIAIVSGCLPNVQGVYSHERVFPHLFILIIAPPASGKGVLKNAKRLADKYHQSVLKASTAAQAKYETDLAEYKLMGSKAKGGDQVQEPPAAPVFKIVFIPANCSASRMIEHLYNNGGQGIICESEADTMSGSKKQDWGDYSPSLRAAFHHETIALTRKINNEYIEINEPRIAVVLSGTPAQAPRLISTTEDGLSSRFLYYAFKSDILWQDPSPKKDGIIYNNHFDALAEQLLTGIDMLKLSPSEIFLTELQWNSLNTTFSSMLDEVVEFTGEDAVAIVYRLGLITFRFCMVFTALRKIENTDASEKLYCSDTDFNNAIELVKTYLQHSILMYNNLPHSSDGGIFKKGNNKLLFLDALPGEFTTKQAAEIGKQFKLSYSTVSKILPKMVPAYFSQPKSGYYIKIKD